MVEVVRVAGNRVHLSNGAVLRAADPVLDARAFDGAIVVVVAWKSTPRRGRRVTLHRENVYGFDEGGRKRWRVSRPGATSRATHYTGFLDELHGLWLHEALGWHVELDVATGSILRAQSIC